MSAKAKSPEETRTVNLALQGGGAHGAFTWGVLDALLEDGRIAIEGISGTSAGAMNAAAYSFGYEQGGRSGARAMLEDFWKRTSEQGAAGVGVPDPFGHWLRSPHAGWNLDWSPAYVGFDVMSRFLSPYQFNPLNYSPLRTVVEQAIDFVRLNACQRTKLFVSATNVRTGKIRVFETHEVTADVLLASACLPYLFQAIEIGGEHYWDGGYMGNPAIFPLIYKCASPDIMIVQVNPINRPDVPTNAREILDRVTEISFNSTLMREMRAIAFVTRLVEEHALDTKRYKKLNMHFVEAEEDMAALGASSKFNTDWTFITHLKDLGRHTAKAWLEAHFEKIGKESSVDLEERFL